MRKRITFYETICKRCGKPITTASQSILGLDGLKARLGSICSDCTTPDEKQEMLQAMSNAILQESQ